VDKTRTNFSVLVVLRRDTRIPLHRQIETSIRDAIRAGRLPRGSPLPPSRMLAVRDRAADPQHGVPSREPTAPPGLDLGPAEPVQPASNNAMSGILRIRGIPGQCGSGQCG